MQPQGLRVIVNVERIDDIVAFYGEVLQLPLQKSWDDETGSAAVFDLGGGSAVEFIGPPYGLRTDPIPARGVELMIAVDDARSTLERLQGAGVPIARQLIENPWGDRSFGLDDSEGRRVWIFEVL